MPSIATVYSDGWKNGQNAQSAEDRSQLRDQARGQPAERSIQVIAIAERESAAEIFVCIVGRALSCDFETVSPRRVGANMIEAQQQRYYTLHSKALSQRAAARKDLSQTPGDGLCALPLHLDVVVRKLIWNENSDAIQVLRQLDLVC
mmetsp:Transcript_1349/g.5790  ORF Transcript_1349/g.5790 Transcript_1349/m.5790 type:complete len:147 (+) Transcript_1349:281-721(+)